MTAATGSSGRSGAGVWIGAAAVIVAVVLLLVLTGRTPTGDPFDVRSPAPDGYKALAILLADRGADVGRTTAAAAQDDPPGPGEVVVVPAPELLTGPELRALRDAASAGAVVVLGTERSPGDDGDGISGDESGGPSVRTIDARTLADTPADPARLGDCDVDELQGLGPIDRAFADPVDAGEAPSLLRRWPQRARGTAHGRERRRHHAGIAVPVGQRPSAARQGERRRTARQRRHGVAAARSHRQRRHDRHAGHVRRRRPQRGRDAGRAAQPARAAAPGCAAGHRAAGGGVRPVRVVAGPPPGSCRHRTGARADRRVRAHRRGRRPAPPTGQSGPGRRRAAGRCPPRAGPSTRGTARRRTGGARRPGRVRAPDEAPTRSRQRSSTVRSVRPTRSSVSPTRSMASARRYCMDTPSPEGQPATPAAAPAARTAGVPAAAAGSRPGPRRDRPRPAGRDPGAAGRGRQGGRRPGGHAVGPGRRAAGAGPRAAGGRARRGQDAAGQDAGTGARPGLQAGAVHARPDAVRRHRSARARPVGRRGHAVPRGPGLHQPVPGRRDQPHAAQDAVGAARGHGGAAGDRRGQRRGRCPTRSS